MDCRVAQKSNNFCPKHPDVIWHTRKEEVMREIAKILGVVVATTETPGWFVAQTRAIKNIMGNMTSEELISLDAKMELFLKKDYNKGLFVFFF